MQTDTELTEMIGGTRSLQEPVYMMRGRFFKPSTQVAPTLMSQRSGRHVGPGGRFSLRYRVSNSCRWRVVFSPSLMLWERLG
jgi:hypothetical protein